MSFGAVASAGDPLKRGLVGWYRMLGNANDSSGRGNAGTLNNSPSLVADKFGTTSSAYSFTGSSSQSITLTQNNALPLWDGSRPVTIATWAKVTSSVTGVLYGEGVFGSFNPIFFLRAAAGNLELWLRSNNGTLMINGATAQVSTVFNDTWTHVAASVNPVNNTWEIYVNGVTQRSGTFTLVSMGVSLNSSIGMVNRGAGTSQNLTGSMFDVRLYGRALTAAEVGTLFRATQRI